MTKLLFSLLVIWSGVLGYRTYEMYKSDLIYKDALLLSESTFFERIAVSYLSGCVTERVVAYGKFSGAFDNCRQKAKAHSKEAYELYEKFERHSARKHSN